MKLSFSLTETEGQWLLRTNFIEHGNARVLEQSFATAEDATKEILTLVQEHAVPPAPPQTEESVAVQINSEQGKEEPPAVLINEAGAVSGN